MINFSKMTGFITIKDGISQRVTEDIAVKEGFKYKDHMIIPLDDVFYILKCYDKEVPKSCPKFLSEEGLYVFNISNGIIKGWRECINVVDEYENDSRFSEVAINSVNGDMYMRYKYKNTDIYFNACMVDKFLYIPIILDIGVFYLNTDNILYKNINIARFKTLKDVLDAIDKYKEKDIETMGVQA